jgi:hypothetical protein
MTSEDLSPDQADALFDILIHHEAYQELRDLRIPGALAHSGPPFKTSGEENQTPLFHTLFSEFIVPLPGLRDVSTDFYQAKCQEIIEEFAKADLSESYEAGYIGIRRTLATAAAALVEAPARGYFGGFPANETSKGDRKYDTSKPEDVEAGFSDFLCRIVYDDDFIDSIFARAAETDKLSQHDSLVQAAHENILIHLASFLHYILIISPQGTTLLTMLRRANALVPYTAIRQTLKVGNAATMINGMLKLVLTKMTINSVTTFLGITAASDAGWNLLQTIVSAVVNWDTSALKSRVAEIESSADGPGKGQREVLDSYIGMERAEHEKCRTMSEARGEPVVVTVMDEYGGEELQLEERQISMALEYLSLHLSLRDRRKITGILCSRQPDLLTQAVREGVAAYDPVIRALHKAVDLSATVGDVEAFVSDLLKFAPSGKEGKDKSGSRPSVADFVKLLRRHQGAAHRFIHQVCKNGPELRDWYKDYAKSAAAKFRAKDNKEDGAGPNNFGDGGGGPGTLIAKLSSAVSQLTPKQRSQILTECTAHATYLAQLSASSKAGMESIFTEDQSVPVSQPMKKGRSAKTSKSSTREPSLEVEGRYAPELGPGVFLRRWQDYVDETAITPAGSDGGAQHGGEAAKISEVKAPSCGKTVELLGGRFREMLRESAPGKDGS